MSVDKVSRDDWIIGGVALLALISLLFFPWFHFSAHVGAYSVSASSSATGSPDAWLGVLALLAIVALIADLAIERFSPQTTLPAISGSRTTTRFVLAVAAAVLLALKFLFHIHFSYFGWGFYFTVVVVGGLVFLASRARSAITTSPTVTPASSAS